MPTPSSWGPGKQAHRFSFLCFYGMVLLVGRSPGLGTHSLARDLGLFRFLLGLSGLWCVGTGWEWTVQTQSFGLAKRETSHLSSPKEMPPGGCSLHLIGQNSDHRPPGVARDTGKSPGKALTLG